ncbi:MAG: hypothetical protein KFH98_10745 [Gemmatimonadetes bacterium]|nr:hypothetical protein [Gemmatimonadota bacterium]
MVREFATALTFGAVLAGAAAGQSVMASATILERVEADAVTMDVRGVDGRLRVGHPAAVSEQGTRLLRSTFVSGGAIAGEEATVAVRVHAEGTLRLERRAVQAGVVTGEQVEPGESLLIDSVERLTITRLVASNS